ncbi:hypothetical protein ACH5RR_033675 [Cinchona calisaya]|uniref:UBN2 domain-containing protein n=1 Tax=Cinchona calisaya TaxID=153742 RepID=A0ABD2Y8M8_9GENT
MEPHENIDKMYCRFNDIVKDLEGLGKEYSLGEKNRNFLNTLPKEWKPKSIAIEESKNLNSMPIESLINSLTSFELKMILMHFYKRKRKMFLKRKRLKICLSTKNLSLLEMMICTLLNLNLLCMAIRILYAIIVVNIDI